MSFLGLVEVLLHKTNGGLHRCYDAVHGFSTNPELYLNLAYAEFILGNRQRSVAAVNTLLEHDPQYYDALQFRDCLGKRKEHHEKRTNPVSNVLGKLFRSKDRGCEGNNFELIFKAHLSKKLNFYIKQFI